MDKNEMSAFVEKVLADAEQKLGQKADPIRLEGYARGALLQLWRENPELRWFTVYKTSLLLRQAIAEVTKLQADVAAPQGAAGKIPTRSAPPRIYSMRLA
ncbi:MAG: hypothetical protein ACJ789_05910 [Thermomicrobiales bacterium]